MRTKSTESLDQETINSYMDGIWLTTAEPYDSAFWIISRDVNVDDIGPDDGVMALLHDKCEERDDIYTWKDDVDVEVFLRENNLVEIDPLLRRYNEADGFYHA